MFANPKHANNWVGNAEPALMAVVESWIVNPAVNTRPASPINARPSPGAVMGPAMGMKIAIPVPMTVGNAVETENASPVIWKIAEPVRLTVHAIMVRFVITIPAARPKTARTWVGNAEPALMAVVESWIVNPAVNTRPASPINARPSPGAVMGPAMGMKIAIPVPMTVGNVVETGNANQITVKTAGPVSLTAHAIQARFVMTMPAVRPKPARTWAGNVKQA